MLRKLSYLLLPTSSSTPNRRRLTKKACIALLQQCKSMKQLKQIHGQVLVTSLFQSRDLVDDLMAFCTHPESGDLSYARKLFDTLPDPSLFVHNLLIRALSKMGIFLKVIDLFFRMREKGLLPDNFAYPFVLKAMGSLRMVSEGRKVHGLVVKSGFEFDPYTRNSLVDMYAEIAEIENARSLFDETPVRDLVLWNVMIASYVKCGRFEEAISVYRRMERESIKPDEATLVTTLSACVPIGDLELGKNIHRHMDEELGFSITLGNALLDMYAKCGCLDAARRLFGTMPSRNVISWTIVVSGYVNSGQLDEARELFTKSPAKDVILWTAMINGYVQYNRFEEAMALFRDMQLKRMKPDKFTAVALLTCCASLGALEQGKWIHGYIKDNKLQVDTVVATALIDMYAKCGYVEKSLEIFERAVEKDTAAWTAVICGLAVNGQTSKALALFLDMERAGAKPDDITFIGVLSACSHGGLVDEGRKQFLAMKEVYGIEPKVEHYGCLVDLLGRAGLLDEAEKLIEDMPNGSEKDVSPLCGALLAACRVHGNVEMGERLAKRVIKQETGNSGMHTLIANIYAAASRWGEVTKVRRKMKDLGVKKTPGCSSIEVNGQLCEFVVGNSTHPEKKEVYWILDNISKHMDLEEYIDTDDINLT
ncbi:pentatricopeptide repeat-containing protein At1g31430 [Typha latifolia]|uniref:pentatricopeptide repeat-containing protein At1g31430 n=1 Tax=Typha latifolia TaxID=4733 RepID=UPI003C2D174F